MSISESISHQGIIEAITSDTIRVQIIQLSACAGCHAKSACTMADQKEKHIEIHQWSEEFAEGENVQLVAKKKQESTAIFWGYIFPLILIVLTIGLSMNFIVDEVYVALLSLGVLIPYYSGLYFFREKLKSSLQFTIQKTK